MSTHEIWSCHVTLAAHCENVYCLPNCILNSRKITKFAGNWLKNKTVTVKKAKLSPPSPPPQCLWG